MLAAASEVENHDRLGGPPSQAVSTGLGSASAGKPRVRDADQDGLSPHGPRDLYSNLPALGPWHWQ